MEPELDNICAVFDARALSNPVTSAVLGDPGRVSRLMSTLRVWMTELLNGPRYALAAALLVSSLYGLWQRALLSADEGQSSCCAHEG